jgi:hypothetical protein
VSRKYVDRSLESRYHAANGGSRRATSVLLEVSNKGLESIGRLLGLVVGRRDDGGLGWSRCGSRRRSGNLSGAWLSWCGTTLRLDALGVIRVPVLAFESLGAGSSTLEAVSTTLGVLLDGTRAGTRRWLRAYRGGKSAGKSDGSCAEYGGDNGRSQRRSSR